MSGGTGLPERWPGKDGEPVFCAEKIKVLRENHEELRQVMQDAFEDALLMGVDEAALRAILHAMVDGMRAP